MMDALEHISLYFGNGKFYVAYEEEVFTFIYFNNLIVYFSNQSAKR